MTAAKLRETLARVEAATGPSHTLTHEVCSIVRDVWGERYSEVCGLFELAVSGGLDAQGAVTALIERDSLKLLWNVAYDEDGVAGPRSYCGSVMIGYHLPEVHYGHHDTKAALALLAAYLRAKIAEAEQREDVA